MADLVITREEVELELGDLPLARSLDLIEGKIKAAIATLRGVCPRVDRLLASDAPLSEVDELNIKTAVINSVSRFMRNDMSGYRKEEESSYAYERDPLWSSANLWFTDLELKALKCNSIDGCSAFGTISTTFSEPYTSGWGFSGGWC